MRKTSMKLACTKQVVNTQRGVYLVLVALLLFVILGICALVLGLGMTVSGEAQFRNVSNVVALGAVEEYLRRAADPAAATYYDRANFALTRANYLLNQNKIVGTSSASDIATLSMDPLSGSKSILTFGTWYQQRPQAAGVDPCALKYPLKTNPYPCFVAAPVPAPGAPFPVEPINAARIDISSSDTNPLVVPFGKVFGRENFVLKADSTATVVPRCTALVLDTSLSTTIDSHTINNLDFLPVALAQAEQARLDATPDPPVWPANLVRPPAGPLPPYHVLWPPNPGLFAYSTENMPPFRGSTQNPPLNCGADDLCTCHEPATYNKSVETLVWCQYLKDAKYVDRYAGGFGDAGDPAHYWSDYKGALGSRSSFIDVPSKYGMVRVDRYRDPEPLTTYLHAFHAALRTMELQASAGDRVVFIAFSGNIRDRVPTTGLTQDLGYLRQLTNGDNRGKKGFDDQGQGFITDQIEPNYVTRGWFPLYSTNPVASGTNLQLALHSAISALSDPTQCPEVARKNIILATDGICTCHMNGINQSAYNNTPTCATDMTVFNQCRINLIGTTNQTLNPQTILARLISAKIALTVLLAGNQAGPNYIDRFVNGHFLNFAEAQALGWGQGPLGMGGLPPMNNMFFEPGSTPANLTCDINDTCPLPPGGSSVDLSYPCRDCVCQTASYNVVGNARPGFCFPRNYTTTYALHRGGYPGVQFRQGNAVLGRLAFESGGIFCPLVDKHPNPAAYCPNLAEPGGPDILCDAYRTDGQAQLYALEDLSRAEIAAKCAQLTVGGTPYSLVTED